MIPSEKECFEILKRFNVPENIVAHSVRVKEICVRIAEGLVKKGAEINMKLLVAGALLHDISKFDCLKADLRHCGHGYKRLLEIGLSKELAEIVRKHGLNSVNSSDPPKTWEEKLVFYADKRVNHDNIVFLEERFAYLRRRYPEGVKAINRAYPKVFALEKEIFKNLEIIPEQIR